MKTFAQIAYTGTPSEAARYLAFRAQECWPGACGYSNVRADYFDTTDLFFPTDYLLVPGRHGLPGAPALHIEARDGWLTITVANAGTVPVDRRVAGKGPDGRHREEKITVAISASDVLEYLSGLPFWQIVEHENVPTDTVLAVAS